jgi:hypothetical protein
MIILTLLPPFSGRLHPSFPPKLVEEDKKQLLLNLKMKHFIQILLRMIKTY